MGLILILAVPETLYCQLFQTDQILRGCLATLGHLNERQFLYNLL